MPSLLRRAAPVPLLMLCLHCPASAKVVTTAEISYFTVGGSTPTEIYHNILEQGPRVNGARALASIATRSTQDGGLNQEGAACRVTDYVITLEFLIQRPRIANEAVLPASEQAMWQDMNRFIAAHENQHRKVWQECAAGLDAKMQTLQAPNCEELGQKAQSLWDDMLSACDRTQRAFDDAQSRALLQQPFMQRALQSAP